MVQLALYKGKGQIGNAFIRWWTGSQYSHCELVVGDYCYSSSMMDKGVRRKKIGAGKDEISLGDNWDLIDLPLVRDMDVIDYFNKTDHYKYGWLGLITSQMFNRNKTTNKAIFCSAWCANPMKLPASSSLSPGTLGDWVVWINENIIK